MNLTLGRKLYVPDLLSAVHSKTGFTSLELQQLTDWEVVLKRQVGQSHFWQLGRNS